LRDFVEKIVKAKLGMYFPLIMHGSALLYEVGDDLDEDMVANYAANLEKVYSFFVFNNHLSFCSECVFFLILLSILI
jgi:uncharacterized protein (UPF0276 family)